MVQSKWFLKAFLLCGAHFHLIAGLMDMQLAINFFKTRSLQHNVLLTCANKKDRVNYQKTINLEANILILMKNMNNLNVLNNIVSDYKRLGIVMDGDCMDAKTFLLRCEKYKVFDTKHFWLVLHSSSSYRYLFENANLNIDSEVKVAYPSTNLTTDETRYILDEVYNPAYGKGGHLKSFKTGTYGTNNEFHMDKMKNKYVVRRNLTGVHFKSLVVLSEPFEKPLENYLLKDSHIEVDSLNRFHARLLKYCRDYHNFSVGYVEVTNSWGYYQPDGTMDGLVGSLERKLIDFGSSPLVIKTERAKFISFGRGTWPLRYEMDNGIDVQNHRERTSDTSWSLSTICTFGVFCQQGIISVPRCLGGRTSAIVALWCGLVIYQFYSASLVSFLLNVPVNVLSTVQDILDNGFDVGYERVLYAMSLLKAATNPAAQEVYRRVSNKNQTGYLRREQGLELVKNGRYAFHVELVTGYPFIEQHFDESMICELKEISLFPAMYMYSGYQKWSPFREFLDACLHRLEENGVVSRELYFWHPRKPQCMRSRSTIKVNTSLEDFYPALVILLIGMAFSLMVLFVEILVSRINARNDLAVNFALFPFTN
ncbi:hypothetical protein HUJ04_004988 [Dendroctonus ponderosae]|nr:hypothetical protein HUJ04_004988 [Dendroctonus ponderosae]